MTRASATLSVISIALCVSSHALRSPFHCCVFIINSRSHVHAHLCVCKHVTHVPQALPVVRRVLGPEHPDTLGTAANLAGVLNDLGEHAEAAATLREVLDVVTRVLGAEHPSTLQKANNLAVMLYCQGKHAEAAAMLREVLNVERRVLGPEHPKTMATAANLDNCTRAASENQTETETDTPAPTV
jgi:hypothetical protein